MTQFISLSALIRAFFALWAFMLCLVNIGSAVLAAVKKRYRSTFLALILFAPPFFMWQVIFDLSLFGAQAPAVAVSRTLGAVPWLLWLIAHLILTAAAALLLGYNIRYDRTFITPGAIKIFLDKVPCGVCCWRPSGRVLFSNICMNRLCVALTGTPLLNGVQFAEAVKGGMLSVDGRVWRFSVRQLSKDGEPLYEMIASDVTTEFSETEALERDKEELSALNRELREYYDSIDDSIRCQEILQAKVSIHDEMNSLMLSLTAASADDTEALDGIFSLWERNALLLCMEAEENSDSRAAEGLIKLAAALDVTLIWPGALPEELNEEQRKLFFTAAREAVINAVKHGGAKTVAIEFSETAGTVECRFNNGGTVPSEPVRFTGGLRNLSLFAEKQGASLSAEAGNSFALALSFPKK